MLQKRIIQIFFIILSFLGGAFPAFAAKDYNIKNDTQSFFFVSGTSGNIGIATTAPVGKLEVRGGPSASSRIVNINGDFADLGGSRTGLFVDVSAPVVGAFGATGSWSQVRTTAAAGTYTSAISGAYAEAMHQGASTVSDLVGLMTLANQLNAGPVTNAYGIVPQIWKGTGTVSNAYGMYFQGVPTANGDTGNVTGTLVNQYGIDILHLTTATTRNVGILLDDDTLGAMASGDYGILQEDTAVNSFAGNIGIGTTTVDAQLTLHSTGAALVDKHWNEDTTAAAANESQYYVGKTGANRATPGDVQKFRFFAGYGAFQEVGQIIMNTPTVTGGNMIGAMDIYTQGAAGTLVKRMSLDEQKAMFANNVGLGTTAPVANLQVGAGAPALAVDLSSKSALIKGNLEVDGRIYGDGSLLTGIVGAVSGLTATHVPVASSPTTLVDSLIYQVGVNIGIGSSAPVSALQLASGQMTLPVGSVAAPSFIFAGSPTTGLFKSAADTIGFSFGSSQKYEMAAGLFKSNATGSTGFYMLQFSGSSTSPVYAFSNDTGTGLSLNAVGSMAFIAGSVNVMNVTGGNVGIGTTSPLSKLDVVGGAEHILSNPSTANINYATTSGSLYVQQDLEVDGNVYLGDAIADTLTVAGSLNLAGGAMYGGPVTISTTDAGAFIVRQQASGTQVFNVDTQHGNVGIGTPTPRASLEVGAGATIPSGSAPVELVKGNVVVDGTLYATLFLGQLQLGMTTGSVVFQGPAGMTQDNANFFWDDTNNRLGIGTTLPAANLDVYGNINAKTSVSVTDNTGFITAANVYGYYYYPNGPNQNLNFKLRNNSYSHLFLDTGDNSLMTIQGTGNVGIGTIAPVARLHVGDAGSVPNAMPITGSDLYVKGNIELDGRIYGDGSGLTGLTGLISGLTDNYIVRANGSTAIENSSIYDTGTNIGIGTTVPLSKLTVNQDGATLRLETASEPGNYYATLTANYNAAEPLVLTNGGTKILGVRELIPSLPDTYLSSYYDVAIATGSVNPTAADIRMYISQAGNVGIGTSAPEAMLQVYGPAFTELFRLKNINYNHTVGFGIDEHAARYGLATFVGGAPVARFDSNGGLNIGTGAGYWDSDGIPNGLAVQGCVGIGTTAPQAKLEVSGDVILLKSADPAKIVINGNTGGSLPSWAAALELKSNTDYRGRGIFMTTADSAIQWFAGVPYEGDGYSVGYDASGVEQAHYDFNSKLFISTSGNIGIGTFHPVAKLDISDAGSAPNAMPITGSDLYVKGNIEFDGRIYGDGSGLTGVTGAISGLTATRVPVASSSTTLVDSGIYYVGSNVGIGTASPAFPLQVRGVGSPTVYADNGYQAGNYGNLIRQTNGITGIISSFGSNGGLGLYSQAASPMGFMIGTLEAMRINPSGNLGIGTATPVAKLHIGDAGSAPNAMSITGNDAYIKGNLEIDGRIYGDGSGLTGITAANPTANNVPKSNGTALIDSSIYEVGGNVGIGTTNPNYKLDVAGDIQISNSNATLKLNGSNVGIISFSSPSGAGTIATYNDNTLRLGAITDAGTTQLVLKSGGNVGVGTSAPAARLHVGDAGNAPNAMSITGSDAYIKGNLEVDGRIYGDGSGLTGVSGAVSGLTATRLPVASSPTTLVDSLIYQVGGNIGIGTASPGNKLDIVGNITLRNTATSGGFLIGDRMTDPGQQVVFAAKTGAAYSVFNNFVQGSTIGSPKTSAYAFWTSDINADSVNAMQLQLANNVTYGGVLFNQAYGSGVIKKISLQTGWDQASTPSQLVLDTTGNVGIGTTVPRALLEVGTTALIPAGSLPTEAIKGNLVVDGRIYGDGSGLTGVSGAVSGLTATRVPVASGPTTLVDSVIYDVGGNIGIGSPSPAYPLVIQKNYNGPTIIPAFNTTDGTAAQVGLSASLTNDFSNNYITMGVTAASYSGSYGNLSYIHSRGKEFNIGTVSTNTLKFFTNGITNTRAVIDTVGNVGIGTTIPLANLHVGAGAPSMALTTPLGVSDALVKGRLEVDSNVYVNGSVGIGSTTPVAPLDIATSPANGSDAIRINTSGVHIFSFNRQNGVANASLSVSAYGGIGLTGGKTTGSEATAYHLYVNPTGNIGIGTTAPVAKLHVGGGAGAVPNAMSITGSDAYIKGNLEVDGRIYGDGSGLTGVSGAISGLTATHVPVASNSTTIVDSNIYYVGGNVGIGTPNPAALLEVSGPAGYGNIIFGQYGGGTYGAMSLNGSLATGDMNFYSSRDDKNLYINRPPSSAVIFRENSGMNAQMVIMSGGNVGIGTNLASAKLYVGDAGSAPNAMPITGSDLYVKGNIELDGRIYGDGSGLTGLSGLISGLTTNRLTKASSATAITNSQLFDDGTNIGVGTTAPSSFFEVGAQKFNVTSDGNVGIGITNPPYTFDVEKTYPVSAWRVGMNINQYVTGTSAVYNGLMGLRVITGDVVTGAGASEVYGIQSAMELGNDGKSQSGFAFQALLLTYANDFSYGLYVADNDSSGGGTDYGVYINLDNTNVTRYGVYQVSANTNYFAGNIGIGTAAPRAFLEVGGAAAIPSGSLPAEAVKGNLVVDGKIYGDGSALTGVSGISGLTATRVPVASSPTTLVDSLIYQVGGNIGIGTSAPSRFLDVAGEVSISGTGDSYFVSNLGIGTTAPASKLDVIGTLNATGAATLGSTLGVTGNTILTGDIAVNGGDLTSSGALTVTPNSGSNLNIALATTGDFVVNTNQLYVDTSLANVGIGTSTPVAKLHVGGGAGAVPNAMPITGSDLYVRGNIELDGKIYGDGSALTGVSSISGLNVGYISRASSPTTIVDSIIYQNGSNIGIGTAVPVAKLSIDGNIYFTPGAGRIISSDDTTDISINPGGILNLGALSTDSIVLGRSDINILTYIKGTLSVKDVAGDQGLSQDANSNVGIGTIVPVAKLHVGGGAGAVPNAMPITGNDLYVRGNIEFDGKIYGDGSQLTGVSGAITGLTATRVPVASNATTIVDSGIYYVGVNVGIGTFSPRALLEVGTTAVIPTGSLPGEAIKGNLVVDGKIYGDGSGLTSVTGAVSGLTTFTVPRASNATTLVDSGIYAIANGNVGIGTTAPIYKLDVVGGNGLRSAKYILGADLSLLPVVGGQSVLSSWWELQLVGNRQAAVDYAPANVGGTSDASVIIPNQKPASVGLIVQNVAAQTANIQEWRNSGGFAMTVVAANGNVGIGTNGPLARLIVIGAGAGAARAFEVDNNVYNPKFVVLDSGNIGLGTTAPVANLHIGGGATAVPNAMPITGSDLYVLGNIEFDGKIYGDGSALTGVSSISGLNAGYISRANSSTTIVDSVIYQNGSNIGIGTSIPVANLHVGTGAPLMSLTTPLGTNDALVKGRLEVDSTVYVNGNVGIGTTNPVVKLQVAGGDIGLDNSKAIDWKDNTGMMYGVLYMDGSNKTHIRGIGGGFVVDDGGGNPQVIVSTGGNVGIGTTAPVASLHIGGGATAVPNAMSITGADLYVKGNIEFDGKIYGDGSALTGVSGAITGLNAGYIPRANSLTTIVDSVIYQNGGSVGIGTTNPAQGKLSVKGNIAAETELTIRGAGLTASNYGRVSHDDNNMTLSVSGGTGHIILQPGGNVGIGTSAPVTKLDVDSTIYAHGNIGIGTSVPMDKLDILNGNIVFSGPDNGVQKSILWRSADGAVTGGFIRADPGYSSVPMEIGDFGSVQIYIDSNNNDTDRFFSIHHNVGTGLTNELFRVQEDGNVGIGTAVPVAALHIGGGAGAVPTAMPNTGSDLYVKGNIEFDGKIYGDGSMLTGVSGAITGLTATRVPVASSPTTIVDSGIYYVGVNVGIGSTSPAAKLDVDSIIYAHGNIGIGTSAPRVSLEVGGGDGAVLSTGTFASGWTEPTLGAGTRMMWYPRKAAFRVGNVNGTQWDNANIGFYSMAIGTSTIASGTYSTAMGFNTTASTNYAIAMGTWTIASGQYSTAMGNVTTAESIVQTTLGQWNLPKGAEDANSWVTTDPLFVIGNGLNGTTGRSNAMMVLKNGNVGIGSTAPMAKLYVGHAGAAPNAMPNTNNDLYVEGNIEFDGKIYGDGSQLTGVSGAITGLTATRVPVASGPTTIVDSGIYYVGVNVGIGSTLPAAKLDVDSIIYAHGNIGIGTSAPRVRLEIGGGDGAVLATGTYGSGWTEPNLGAGTRMMWYPRKAAFRVGGVTGTEWNDANIGIYSTAIGYSAIASGQYSQAMGQSALASNADSFAIGSSANATGTSSIAIGRNTVASGSYSTALGNDITANALYQTTAGLFNLPKGGESAGSWVSTDPLFVIGNGTGSGANRSTVMMLLKNGNVGLGTVDPTAKLVIVGSGAAASKAFEIDNNLYNPKVVVLDNGNVGIGTILPVAALAVGVGQPNAMPITGSDLYVLGNIEFDGKIYGDGSALTGVSSISGLTDNYIVRANGTNAIEISNIYDNGTNIGIGTIYPVGRLQVGTGAPTMGVATALGVNDALIKGRLEIDSGLYVSANVGIGTSAPKAKLHVGDNNSGPNAMPITGNDLYVLGNIEFDGKIYGDGSQLTGVSGAITGLTATRVPVALNSTTIVDSIIYQVTGNIGIGTGTPVGLLDVSRKMMVLSNGNVGIGTTVPNNLIQVVDLITFDNTNTTTKIGYQAGENIVSGAVDNTFVGNTAGFSSAGSSTNAADGNTAVGFQAFYSNTTGDSNTAIGLNALFSNTQAQLNTAVGRGALLSNTSGSYNTALGSAALGNNVLGLANVAVGGQAGEYIADDVTANTRADHSTYLGYDSRPLASNGDNEIVIGYNAIGLGSNTVVLGNTSILTTMLRGNVGINTSAPVARLAVAGVGTTTSRAFEIDNNLYNPKIVVFDNGNVGLGTTAPVAALHIGGGATAAPNAMPITGSDLYVKGNIEFDGKIYGDGSALTGVSGAITGLTATRVPVASGPTTIVDSGIYYVGVNVGIGSTSPAAKLDVDAIIYAHGNIGIGTSAPRVSLEIGGGDGAVLAAGTYGSGWTEPNLGAGTRMMWYPRKAAFRAGNVNGTQWDNANIGGYSAALGLRTTASGLASTATGQNTIASGQNSTAMGNQTTASGSDSTAIGVAATAESFSQITLGRYNLPKGGETAGSWVATDPLFVIGSGNGPLSTAMMILKNGNVGLGTVDPTAKLVIVGSGTTTNKAFEVDDSLYSTKVVIFDNGNVGLGTTAPVAALHIGGGATAAPNAMPITGSDLYVKGNIELDGKIYGDGSALTGVSGAITGLTATRMPVASNSTTIVDSIIYQVGVNVGIGTGTPAGLLDVSRKMTVLSGGNVGIGTVTPVANLHIGGAGAVPNAMSITGSDLYVKGNIEFDGKIYGDGSQLTGVSGAITGLTATRVPVASSSTTIVDSGIYYVGVNVGIGSTAPRGKLEVDGSIYVNGNIGIGTTMPSSALDIRGMLVFNGDTAMNLYEDAFGNLSTDASMIVYGTYGISARGFTDIATPNNAAMYVLANGSSITRNIADANPVVYIQNLNAGSTGDIAQFMNSTATLMVIKQGGNIGINTSTPVARLSVAGVGTTTARAFEIDNNLYNPKLVVFDNGNVGLGTTAPVAALHIGGGATAVPNAMPNTGSDLYVKGNIELDGKIYGDGSALTGISGAISGLNAGYIPRASTSTTIVDSGIYQNASNIGIGTTGPVKKFEVKGGDVYINQTSSQLIMKKPDGTCASCGPNNSDIWVCAGVACP